MLDRSKWRIGPIVIGYLAGGIAITATSYLQLFISSMLLAIAIMVQAELLKDKSQVA